MSTLWRLRLEGPLDLLKAADARLAAAEEAPALAWSWFELGPETGYLEILFDARIDEAQFIRLWALEGFETHFAPLPEEDWVAMSLQGLPSVKAGRFRVYGEHTEADVRPDEIGLLIEAGPAFGTGHHGTTLGCLKALDALYEAGARPARILDLGTGTGLLAIAAKKLWPEAYVLATDIDSDSVEETEVNAAKNAVTLEAVTADGFDHPVFDQPGFDLVLANILAGPLVELAPGIAERTNKGGAVVLSGLLEEQIGMVAPAYERQGMTLSETGLIEGWATLVFEAPV
ncbi:MAG: 50S ribosomal protein L11 methyltransferase [Oceanicaulis sp.]